MTQLLLIDQPVSGKQLADRGIRKVASRNHETLEQLRAYACYHCLKYGTCTSDDVRKYAEEKGLKLTHPNAYGAIFRNGAFDAIGWKESEIESNHARPVRIWKTKTT